MKRLALVLLVVLVAGCGKSRPTYQLTIGDETFDLTVHDDPKQIQDEIISKIKPLWDKLETGDSATFRYRRVQSSSVGGDLDKKVKAKFGDNARLTCTRTRTSRVYRFFKQRDGQNGVEASVDGKEDFNAVFWGPDLDWGYTEHSLREGKLCVQSIQMEIQGDFEEERGKNRQ